MIVPRYYENLNVLHENTMPARAYYIPASRRMDNLVEHREESDRMQLLNGTWKFQYFNSIYDIQDSFFEKNYDTENFDEIQVPSVWQMAGYDTHQYTTSGIHFRLIHHMCHRTFRVEPMYILLSTVEMRKRQNLF